MKVSIKSERVIADVGSEGGAKRRVVLTRKTRTSRHVVKDHEGNVESVSYDEHTDVHRELRVVGLPFVAKISTKDDHLSTEKQIESGVNKIKGDLQKALSDLKEITEEY